MQMIGITDQGLGIAPSHSSISQMRSRDREPCPVRSQTMRRVSMSSMENNGARLNEGGGPQRRGSRRNSNIEALRLFSMFCIVIHHFYVHNGTELSSLPDSLVRDMFSVYGVAIGKVGVALFLIISVWYTNEETLTFDKQLHRWMTLEKELLFYSILLSLVVPAIMDPGDIDQSNIFRAFFPVLKRVWWFVSDYVILILVLPFVRKGLKALTRIEHLQITALLVVVYAVLQYCSLLVSGGSNFVMLLTIVCVAYYLKWHVVQRDTIRYIGYAAGTLCAAIVVLPVLYYLSLKSIPFVSAKAEALFDSVSSAQSIIVLCIAFPVFLMVNALPARHSALINTIAQSTLAVYLISDIQSVRSVLWKSWFTFDNLGGHALLKGIGVCVVVMAACLAIDFIRRGLFALIFGKRHARLGMHMRANLQ